MNIMLTSAPQSSVLSVKILDIMITSAPRRIYILTLCINYINNSRIVEDVHISFKITSDFVDELIKSSTPALDEVNVHKESISDV